MGTHPKSPSLVRSSNQVLSDYLAEHPELIGAAVADKFDANNGNLPFLFKVLSIHKALSIQSHPDKPTAEKLHAEHPDIYKGKGLPLSRHLTSNCPRSEPQAGDGTCDNYFQGTLWFPAITRDCRCTGKHTRITSAYPNFRRRAVSPCGRIVYATRRRRKKCSQ